MKKIYKYPIPVDDKITLSLPINSDILTVQLQKGEPVVYALVNTAWTQERDRKLELYGTGMEVLEHRIYIGTFQMLNGGLVFHLFENNE